MVIKKGRGGRGGRRDNKQGDNRHGKAPDDRDKYAGSIDALQKNPAFEAYYLDQGILPFEEWDNFMTHLRTPLPTSFRITSGKATTNVLLEQMKEFYLPFLSNVQYEGEKIPPPQTLPWYPENLGWQINVKKNALRKTEEFKKFQHFLVHETEVGNISRQETVSMIPPLFLNVQPHHLVLDMCAAPGSKTAQLIEAIHSPLTVSSDSYDPCPPGLIVANDSDAKRAHMLIHQSQRLPSPNLVVANYDATQWPTIKVPHLAKGETNVKDRVMLYDRILADVPCSGDGTIRKNLMLWKDWHPYNGASLHTLQLRILLRGIANLRNGGRIVYSTCSMNPSENEAVVAAAIRLSGGTISLVDQTGVLPDLKRRKGLTTWKVLPIKGKLAFGSKTGDDANKEVVENGKGAETSYRQGLPRLPFVNRWEDVEDSLKEKIPETLWPAGDEEALHLDRCMRIYSHDQNTGGFFVAVLEKRVEGGENFNEEGMALGMIRAMEKLDADDDRARVTRKRSLSPTMEQASIEPNKKLKEEKEGGGGEQDNNEPNEEISESTVSTNRDNIVTMAAGTPYREDPMAYVDLGNEQIQAILSFFEFNDKFDARNLLVRNKEAFPLRSIYLTSTSARALISSGGPGKGQHPYGNPLKMRLLNSGIRAFQKQESGKDIRLQCKWRVMSDGIPALRPFLKQSKIVKTTLDEFAFLLRNHYPKIEDVPKGLFRDQVYSLEMGSHFCDVQAGTWKGGHKLDKDFCIPIWRAAASLNVMLDRQEKSALSFRIFGSDLSHATGERQFANTAGKKQKAPSNDDVKKEPAGLLDEDALQEMENAAAAVPPHTILP